MKMSTAWRTAGFATTLMTLSLAAGAQAASLDVVEGELRRNVQGDIDWVNFTGVVRQFDSDAAIRGIGDALGASLERGGVGRYGLRYTMIRAADPATAAGFDADILSLEPEARVNHIDNVRRILVGYLQATHGYDPQDANALAVFATVYNALLRGDVEYFASAYKPVVLQHINTSNAGIATNYVDWPGKTRLLIPLSSSAGALSALSTAELADSAVIEELRQDPDQGLEVRKDMVDLRERQIDEQQDELQQDQATAEQQQQQLVAERQQLSEEQDAASQDLAQATTTDTREAADAQLQDLEQREQELADRQQQAEAETERLAATREDLSDQQSAVDQERDQIVADEQSRDVATAAQDAAAVSVEIFSDKLYFLTTQNTAAEGYFTTQLAVIDPLAGSVTQVTDVPHIAERNFTFFGDGIIAVAHRASAATPTTLVLLDATNLQLQSRGAETVYRQTHLLLQGQFAYAVVERAGQFTVGKFDPELNLLAESTATVEPRSYLAVFGDDLYVSGDSAIQILDRNELTSTGSITR